MAPNFIPVRYRFPEQLRFKHLGRHELFMFPAGNGTPAMGPYMKLSARRYVPVDVSWVGGVKAVPHIRADARVHHVGTINAAVTDQIHHHTWGHG